MENENKKLKIFSEDELLKKKISLGRITCDADRKGVKMLNDEDLNINDLPEEILMTIFGYLKYEDLCRAGRVCTKWHAISRDPVFWKRVDIKFPRECASMSKAAMKFVEILPSSVSHLRLYFEYATNYFLDFTKLSKKLAKNCPNLQVLVLHRARLMFPDCPRSILYLNRELAASIQVFALHHCRMKDGIILSVDKLDAKIYTLDISRTTKLEFHGALMNMLPHIRDLRLSGSDIHDLVFGISPYMVSRIEVLDLEGTRTGPLAFRAILNYGFHLIELYMCSTSVEDKDLDFSESTGALPCLQKICLRASNVTYVGITRLLKFCKSLQHIYVGDLVPDPENDYAKCNSEKVHIIHGCEYCDHYAKVNYMCM